MFTENKSEKVIAVFDFDGTLTTRNSSLLFYRLVSGNKKYMVGIILSIFVWLLSGLRIISSYYAQYFINQFFLGNLEKSELEYLAKKFIDEQLPKILRPSALVCLDEHKKQGHICILLSGSLDIYLKFLAEKYNFDNLICTELIFNKDNKCTAHVIGHQYCMGKVKQEKLQSFLQAYSGYTIYGYGDSKADREFLKMVDYPFYRKFK